MMAEIREALEVLKNEGYKLTDKREKLLKILSKEDRYLSARQVYEEMLEKYPSISLDTIYRNLQTYSELGLLEETEWDNERVYRFRCGIDEHHHHFICTLCGYSEELTACPVSFFKEQLGNSKVTSHRFELFGLCENCLVEEPI